MDAQVRVVAAADHGGHLEVRRVVQAHQPDQPQAPLGILPLSWHRPPGGQLAGRHRARQPAPRADRPRGDRRRRARGRSR
ncbi:hypothetical protein [Actinomadura sp. RB99]|uniref:hypothetical protein n=1 Tax=Actinomadura sp. RB99 TaxID=2691577 RepID=UPI001686D7B0|nr:hypothetical protein [Actinomadura sp. RB99]